MAVELLDRIKEAGVDKEAWQRQPREASGFAGDDLEKLKAICVAQAQRIDIGSGDDVSELGSQSD